MQRKTCAEPGNQQFKPGSARGVAYRLTLVEYHQPDICQQFWMSTVDQVQSFWRSNDQVAVFGDLLLKPIVVVSPGEGCDSYS